MMMALISLCQK